MKTKKTLTTLLSCLAIIGLTTVVKAENHGYESSRDTYPHYSSSHSRYYTGDRDYRGRSYYHQSERKILREIRKNEQRIRKLERKIHKLSRYTYYKGYHRTHDIRQIRQMEYEIRRLTKRNQYLRRLLNHGDSGWSRRF